MKRKLDDAHADEKTGSSKKSIAPWTSLGSGADIGYWPKHIGKSKAVNIFNQLLNDVPWAQHDVKVFGRTHPQPRLIAYYADPETGTYTYSHLSLEPTPFTPVLLELKSMVEDLLSITFNSALLNYYRDGTDYVGWHSDNEKLYGQDPTIVSVSLGHPRDFIMRERANHNNKKTFVLGPGDVFVMRGDVQRTWQHTVPVRRKEGGPRISVTFRTIMAPVGKG